MSNDTLGIARLAYSSRLLPREHRLMDEMQACFEKLSSAAAECALIAQRATDQARMELFARLAEHLEFLAWEVEETMMKARTP